MPRKVTTAQAPYTLLVANLTGGSDPSRNSGGNPVKARTAITFQHFPEVNRQEGDRSATVEDPSTPGLGTKMGHVDYTTDTVPVNATGTITVADNDFTDQAAICLGAFELISGVDFTVAGSTALTATNLAAAIDALPGFSAPAPGASVITVTGPAGPDGNHLLFEAIYRGTIANYTLSPSDGSLGSAEPTIGPPLITP